MAAPEDTIAEPVVDSEKTPGDASLKRKVMSFIHANPEGFSPSIGARLEVIEVSVVPKREDAQVMEARAVTEVDVVPGVFPS